MTKKKLLLHYGRRSYFNRVKMNITTKYNSITQTQNNTPNNKSHGYNKYIKSIMLSNDLIDKYKINYK